MIRCTYVCKTIKIIGMIVNHKLMEYEWTEHNHETILSHNNLEWLEWYE